MTTYTLTNDPTVILRDDGACIPVDNNNQDYKDYLLWVANGNTANPIPLADQVNFKLADLAKRFDTERYKNIVYNSLTYYADYDSQLLIANSLSSYDRGYTSAFPANWTMADNSVISHSYADIKGLSFAISDRTKLCYANYQSLAAQIAASTDPSTIDITTGWPA